MRTPLLIVIAVTAAATASASAGPDPVQISDLLRLRTVTSIDVARDATRAVLAVKSIATASHDGGNGRAEYEYRSHLYVLDLFDEDAMPRQLTFGSRRDGDPRLSPDGRLLAFVRGGDDEAHDEGEKRGGQVWILALDGGEARRLTDVAEGAARPRWSPDGRHILFTSAVPLDELGTPPWPAERPGRAWNDVPEGTRPDPDGSIDELRAWLDANASEHDPLVINRLDFQGEHAVREAMKLDQLWIVSAIDEDPAASRVTSGFFDHHDAAFMPDGRSIVYAGVDQDREHPDRVLTSHLRQVGTDGTNDRVLLAIDGWIVEAPEPSLDGAMVAFSGRPMDHMSDRQSQLGLVSLGQQGASEPVWMTEPKTFDHSVRDFRWMPARASLLFTSPVRGGVPLMSISPGLLKPVAVVDRRDDRPVGVTAFAAGGGTIVYAETRPQQPCTLRVADGRGDRQAWDLNPWVAEKRLSIPEEGWIDRPDGTRIQYWIMEPIDREPGKRYPLVLEMHGGPSAMWGPGEATMWHELQVLTSRGYGVVYANPRGSGGYGHAFQRANFQDWGTGPAGDVLAAVDEALVRRDWIDRDRMVVTGGSYAGYLTAWIVAHDHRFKAAVAQRGVYDLGTFFGEGNAWRLVEWEMGGWPWDPRTRDIIRRNSPWTSVAHIRTPLLVMHASNDLRTGVSQSQMLYRALKTMGRPVEYVRYPGAGHDLSRTGDPGQRLDRLGRIVEFFDRYVGEREGGVASAGGGG